MWKSVVMFIMAFPLSIAAFLLFWTEKGWKSGIVAGTSTFSACVIAAMLMLFLVKKFSLVDVFLPLIFSVVWSGMLSLLTVGADLFTAPAAIGSGFILTLCLWKVYHDDGVGRYWLIFPAIVYMYEMLPVNIPGPFDDYFSLGGDVVCAILFYAISSFTSQLPPVKRQVGRRISGGA